MKFLISRASDTEGQRPPIKGAVFEWFTRVQVRTLPTFEAFDAKFGEREGPWLSKGQNHRQLLDQGHIARDIPDDASGWFTEVDSLEALIALNDEHGTLSLGWSMWNPDVREIEIQDGYY